MLTTIFVGVLLAAPPAGPLITDAEILHQARYKCRNANPEKVDMNLLNTLLTIEKKWNVPNSLRGMLLASACQESGYDPNAEGDHKFHPKRKAKAHGLFQMWPWWASKRSYGIDRKDPVSSANAYLDHITKQLRKVRKKCKIPIRKVKKNWIVAWVTGIRGYKKEGRCRERPLHLRTLKRWHKNILAGRQN